MQTIRAIINRLKWSSEGGLSDCEIIILHRGAPGNLRSINGRSIKDVAPRALICEDCGEETLIPYHRVRLIKKGTKTVWAKVGSTGSSASADAGGTDQQAGFRRTSSISLGNKK